MPKHRYPTYRLIRPIAKHTARAAAKSAEGVFRWAATDHSGMAGAMSRMPKMGFFDTLKYSLIYFVARVGRASSNP